MSSAIPNSKMRVFMFEKSVITILKSGAAVIYVLIMLTLFAAPVLFIWQAFTPPVFTFDSIEISENLENDEELTDKNKEYRYKIVYKGMASSGKSSPYSYEIPEFTINDDSLSEAFSDYTVVLDEPLCFSASEADSFSISLYINSETEPDFSEIAKNVSFKAVNCKKSFGEFYLTLNKSEK